MALTQQQINIYHEMAPREKLALAAEFNQAARELKRAALSMRHPEWSDQRLQNEVRKIFCMRQTDLFLLFTGPLDTKGIRYVVGGSVASMVYGEPRLTNDIDIVIDLSPGSSGSPLQRVPDTEFYCPPEEVVVIESRRPRRGHFNIIHHQTGHKADCYMRGADPLQDWGLDNRNWIDLGDERGIWVSPPEYIIVRKLEYFREGGSEKHIHDIQGMLQASAEIIDMATLQRWIAKLGLEDAWETVRQHG